ncbi:MAG: hypothetical protein KC416_01700 [Myxococcales bacterium]|nr:hypothetical protein [Myxococcales bacterium]
MRPLLLLLGSSIFLACGSGAPEARKTIQEKDVPWAQASLHDDISRHVRGTATAAERLKRGFLVEDPAVREEQLRVGLRYVQEPPRGIPEFIASPMSFLAAIGPDGKVICRDTKAADDDKLRGLDFAEMFPVVQRALDKGMVGHALGTFESPGEGEDAHSMLFVHPVMDQEKTVGAVVTGIPLWRWAQRLTNQGMVEQAETKGLVFWVLAYHGDQLIVPKAGVEEAAVLHDGAARREDLAKSPGGFTGEVQQYGRWFGYGVLPVPTLGSDVGLVIVR